MQGTIWQHLRLYTHKHTETHTAGSNSVCVTQLRFTTLNQPFFFVPVVLDHLSELR